jgi:serine phosphatase RsbU (regulator of sigma subunit)
MLPFNTFSIHALLSFMIAAPLAVIFLLIYWKLGRRILDLVFAGLVACCAAACLAAFLADNVVQAGDVISARTDPQLVRDLASRTLLCIRWMYVLAIIGMAGQLHFVLFYCRGQNVLIRHIRWVYAAFLIATAAAWSPLFLEARGLALAETGSWLCAAPLQPKSGPLLIPFLAVWLAVQVYSLVLLWGHGGRTSEVVGGPLSRLRLLRWAILVQAAGGLTAAGAAGLGYAGPSVFSISSVAAAILVATALCRERIDADREKQRIQRDLELASRIQEGLLPRQGPSIHGFDAAGWSRPAQEAGGDTYDLFLLPDERWMVTLSDASGHGIGPALIISETRAMLRAFGSRCGDALDVLCEARRLLVHDLSEGQFVTCFLGLLDVPAAALSYASAGHGPIIFYDRDTDGFRTENATQLPLPLVSPLEKESPPVLRQWRFRSGDLLVVASDGFWEAFNARGQQFGTERLLDVLYRARNLSACEIIEMCRQEIDRFTMPARQSDDLTIVVLRKH